MSGQPPYRMPLPYLLVSEPRALQSSLQTITEAVNYHVQQPHDFT